MAKPIIFLGPSLSHEKARAILPDADYRGPAKKGDLLKLATDPDAKLVGLVDGVFLQDYPPTPIEVYHFVMKQGVVLAGAASLGALRAVELEKFGMIGIGKVFELYRDGRLNADDEVAVTFSPDGDYRLQSEAMVDIRFNLFLAMKKEIIVRETKRIIARVAKDIYFPQRNYPDIIEETRRRHGSLDGDLDAFQQYVSSNRRSLKEMDAIRLVRYFKQRAAG
ncbi:MAG: TfuA-like protein [Nitrososphaera sp.]